MANVIKHKFVSAAAEGSDASKVRTSNWNDEHAFAGGALGSLLYRDTGQTDGASWLADVAVGSVLVSGGVGAAPAWSATPSFTKLTLAHGTIVADASLFDTSVTWNNAAVIFSAPWKLAVTNTASGGGGSSMLVDVLVGGSRMFGVRVDGVLFTGGRVEVPSTSGFYWGARGNMNAAADGVFTLYDTANTSFGRLQFGGTTSSFPALKRASAGIEVKLADDSAFTTLKASALTVSSGTFLIASSAAFADGAAAATGTLTNAPAAGNPTKWIAINDNGTTRYIPAW